jgi:hypothetical protein
MDDSPSARPERRRLRLRRIVSFVSAAAVVAVVATVVFWPTNGRRLERVTQESILLVAPEGQSVKDAVSTYERRGENSFLLPWTEDDGYASRHYRLPDDADKSAVILDYARALLDDDWKDIVIYCDEYSLKVTGAKQAQVRVFDSFTMVAHVGVHDGVFLQDSEKRAPTFRRGGLGVGVLVSAPPVRGGPDTPTYDIKDKPPTVITDQGCPVDSITGEEAELLLD